jgi:hypothetical protein
VAAGVAALVALPLAVGALPARDPGLPATELLGRVRASTGEGYSGYAEAVGGLRLPLTEDFSTLTDLFGDRTRLRVWWRGPADYRVDAVRATSETDVYRDANGQWTWDYGEGRALHTTEPSLRLPRAADLEPAALGRRLLSEARPGEVSSLPARRVANRSAAGLRLRPAEPGTTVDRVDVWVEPASGVPLRVEVYGSGAARPVLSSAFLDFRAGKPSPSQTRFVSPGPDRVRRELTPDLAAAINVFSRVMPPATLAGLPLRRRVEGLGSVGTYGSGVAVLVAVPLPGRVSRPLQDQLARTPGARLSGTSVTGGAIHLTVGPLSLLLSDPPGRRSWLFTGTVTDATLGRAAAEIAARPPGERP